MHTAVEAQFSMTSYTTNEAAASVEVVIRMTTTTETVQVNISTVDGTALGKSAMADLGGSQGAMDPPFGQDNIIIY